MPEEMLYPLLIALAALVVSIIALVFTVSAFRRKAGHNLRGSYSPTSSIYCADRYVSSVVIENLKDRAIIIFKIFLRIGHNYYVELEDFEDKPYVLEPYGVLKKEYDPIDFYSINLDRINLNDLIDNPKVRKRLVLSTSLGKYIVKRGLKAWDPSRDFFENYMTALIRPMRSTYKDRSYGENARFIIEIATKDGPGEIIPVYKGRHGRRIFKKFDLPAEAFETRESLELFLYEKVEEGLLVCTDLKVHDLERWRDEVYEMDKKETIRAEPDGWLMYHVIGRVCTALTNFKTRRQNKRRAKKQAREERRAAESRKDEPDDG